MNDSTADKDDKIAMLEAMGVASNEAASRALDECGGNVTRAMTLLHGDTRKPTRHESSTARNNTSKPSHHHGMEEETGESIAKPGVILQPEEGVGQIRTAVSSSNQAPPSLPHDSLNDLNLPSLGHHDAHQVSPVTSGAVAVGGPDPATTNGDDEYTLTAPSATQPSPAVQTPMMISTNERIGISLDEYLDHDRRTSSMISNATPTSSIVTTSTGETPHISNVQHNRHHRRHHHRHHSNRGRGRSYNDSVRQRRRVVANARPPVRRTGDGRTGNRNITPSIPASELRPYLEAPDADDDVSESLSFSPARLASVTEEPEESLGPVDYSICYNHECAANSLPPSKRTDHGVSPTTISNSKSDNTQSTKELGPSPYKRMDRGVSPTTINNSVSTVAQPVKELHPPPSNLESIDENNTANDAVESITDPQDSPVPFCPCPPETTTRYPGANREGVGSDEYDVESAALRTAPAGNSTTQDADILGSTVATPNPAELAKDGCLREWRSRPRNRFLLFAGVQLVIIAGIAGLITGLILRQDPSTNNTKSPKPPQVQEAPPATPSPATLLPKTPSPTTPSPTTPSPTTTTPSPTTPSPTTTTPTPATTPPGPTVTVPPVRTGNSCEKAIGPLPFIGTITRLSNENGQFEWACDSGAGGPGAWVKFIGTGEWLTVSTCTDERQFSTILSMYKSDDGSCSVGQLDCIHAAESGWPHSDCWTGLGSTVTIASEPGVVYYALVVGVDGATGEFNLTL